MRGPFLEVCEFDYVINSAGEGECRRRGCEILEVEWKEDKGVRYTNPHLRYRSPTLRPSLKPSTQITRAIRFHYLKATLAIYAAFLENA